MKKTIQKKCIELWHTIQKQNLETRAINIMLVEYAEANRKFANGEIVAICDKESNQEIGRGIVNDVMTMVTLDGLWLKDYHIDKKFNDDIEFLKYEIFAMKKDGTKSTKHFFENPHWISDINSYGNAVIIKKINSK